MKAKPIAIVAVVVLALSPATVAMAAVKNWIAGSGTWNTAGNWSPAGVPGAGDDVNIKPIDGVSRTITYDYPGPAITLNSLGVNLNGGIGFATTTLSMSGNNLMTGELDVGWSGFGGSGGNGTFTQTGGVTTVNGPGVYIGVNATDRGTYNLSSSASLSVSTSLVVGSSGTGVLNIQGNATAATDSLLINSASAVNLNGGTLRFNTVSGTGGVTRIFYTAGTIQLAGNRDFSLDGTIAALFSSHPTVPAGKGLTIEGDATVYDFGVGKSLLVNGGSFTSNRLELGKFASGQGRTGNLEITDGGTVTSNTDGIIALDDFATATATVSGPGSTWNVGDEMWVGGQGDSGVLNIRDGALVHIATKLYLAFEGVINLDGGTIRFNDYLRFLNGANDGIFNFNTGTIQLAGNRNIGSDAAIIDILGAAPTLSAGKGLAIEGDATISSALNLNGGTLRATNLIINGSFHFGGGLLELSGGTISGLANLAVPTGGEFRASGVQSVRIAGAAGSTITATGNLTLGNASAVNGFGTQGTFQAGANTITLLDANDVVFDSLSLATLGSGASPGTLNAANGLTLGFGGNITGFGTISTPNNVAKPLINNGHITGNSAAQRITLPGYVKGVGTFDNVNITGTFSPGLSPTILSVGNVTFSPTSTLIMELGGTMPGSGYDQIQSAGTIELGGTLQISLINGFAPSAGQSFNILDWGSLAGTFSSLSLPALSGLTWNTSQLYTTGVLSIASPGLPGDFNQDGAVDTADFVAWRKGIGAAPTPDNYNLWRTNFGQTAGAGSGAYLAPGDSPGAKSAAPEPNAATLCLIVASFLLCRGRRLCGGRDARCAMPDDALSQGELS
jgi:T5SS/PEP-CTERM-associated repeat protein